MTLSTSDIQKIAKLSRIRMEPEEYPGVAEQLSGIFSWIDKLRQVDTSGIQPYRDLLSTSTPERLDHVVENNQADAVLSNAPSQEFSMYKVPKVVE